MSGNHHASAASRGKGRLRAVFFLTGAYLIAEVIGGLVTGSLALLADAGHMLTDVGGLGLAMLAIRFNSAGAELMVLSRTPEGRRIAAIHWSSRARRPAGG